MCVHVWKNIHDKCVRGYLNKGVVIEMLKGRCHDGADSGVDRSEGEEGRKGGQERIRKTGEGNE